VNGHAPGPTSGQLVPKPELGAGKTSPATATSVCESGVGVVAALAVMEATAVGDVEGVGVPSWPVKGAGPQAARPRSIALRAIPPTNLPKTPG
jgi:hypothetical protein